jgi:hypothetical protein
MVLYGLGEVILMGSWVPEIIPIEALRLKLLLEMLTGLHVVLDTISVLHLNLTVHFGLGEQTFMVS